MTKEDLNQIYYLDKEIKMWQDELYKIKNKSTVKSTNMSAIIIKSCQSNDVLDLIVDLTEIESIINDKLIELQLKLKNIINYINNINDSFIRQIIYYRHVRLMKWSDVAAHIGGGNSEESVRKSHDRYLNINFD